ncbi:MAG TPA: CopG family transcriptional regulator [Chloroflexi bacterium]|nr:CopG family transcriptional regulator [Chloroflexota bacterium]
MSQVTIYLDKDTEERMRVFTKSLRISQSEWVAALIQEKLQNEWPESVASLAGAWADFPSAEEIRSDWFGRSEGRSSDSG